MVDRPYTLLSCGMSLDGYLDSATIARLQLSNDADFDRVDAVRASCDAILVGANTVRTDNPRLLVRSSERRRERVARGLAPSPMKITMTARGDLARLLPHRVGAGRVTPARTPRDSRRCRPAADHAAYL